MRRCKEVAVNDRIKKSNPDAKVPKPEVEIIVDGKSLYKPGMKTYFADDIDGNANVGNAVFAGTYCSCDMVCTCQNVCSCVGHCSCNSVTTCTCNKVQTCSCVSKPTCSCVSKTSCSCVSKTSYGGSYCSCVPVH